jgi:DNA-binding PadR family transcriptional regulator
MKLKTKSQDSIPALSGKEALVLDLLLMTPSSEKYGLELVSESDNGLSRGTVYVTLSRMEDKGYVGSRLDEPQRPTSGLPRRLYRATGYGQRVFEVWQMAREVGRLRMIEIGVPREPTLGQKVPRTRRRTLHSWQ